MIKLILYIILFHCFRKSSFIIFLDINDCYPNACENGGTCIDGNDAYNCICASGFTGDICQGTTLHIVTLQ